MAFSLLAGMTPDVAKEHIATFGNDIANAVEADRDWFRKHPGRKWRVRPVAFGEFPTELLECKCGRCHHVVVVHKIAPKVRIRRVRIMDATSTLPATDAAIKARFWEVRQQHDVVAERAMLVEGDNIGSPLSFRGRGRHKPRSK